ncbi:MAG TPA: DUF4870 domain-containing protein [Solirubrobacteraceae bacterium]|nr:DUF4870 domain-containing protein [Solirubrobacteraceae bacterium]
MDAFGRPDAPPPAAPGWYPDPGGSAAHRYWDGTRWTDALSSAIPPASPTNARDDSRNFALAAHLSALLALFVGFPFIGPLVIYLIKKDDPFVRGHAAEALNFNLSMMLYGVVLLVVGVILLIVVVGILVWLLLIPLGIAWLVFVVIAAVKAGQGEAYRYPLTIRFVN